MYMDASHELPGRNVPVEWVKAQPEGKPSAVERPYEAERATGGLDQLIVDLRFRANRHIFRAMLATSGAAAVAAHQILPRRHWLLPDSRSVWAFAKLQARNLARLVGVSVTVRGSERIATGGPYIITPNHQSHFDIVALLGFLPGHSRFATKRELFSDPILGPVLRTLGMVPIDRDQPPEAIRRLNAIQGAGWSLIMFPEGTRGDGGRLLPFKKGAFATAIQLGIPVVPVAIRGSAAVMPKGGYLGIHPGSIEIVVDDPIPTQALTYDDRVRLRNRVRATIARHLEQRSGFGAR
jgi:1-acyl-sn-glycerol-3-phosphate acyltransferase